MAHGRMGWRFGRNVENWGVWHRRLGYGHAGHSGVGWRSECRAGLRERATDSRMMQQEVDDAVKSFRAIVREGVFHEPGAQEKFAW